MKNTFKSASKVSRINFSFNVATIQFQTALITRRYNLALTLLWKAKDNTLLTKLNKDRQTLLHVLALKSKANAHQATQKRASMRLKKCRISSDFVITLPFTVLHRLVKFFILS